MDSTTMTAGVRKPGQADLDDLPPISGGSDEAEGETRGPTAEDWAEYRAHFDRPDEAEALFGYE